MSWVGRELSIELLIQVAVFVIWAWLLRGWVDLDSEWAFAVACVPSQAPLIVACKDKKSSGASVTAFLVLHEVVILALSALSATCPVM